MTRDPSRPFSNMKWWRRLCSYCILINDRKVCRLLHVVNNNIFMPPTNKITCVADNTITVYLYTAAVLLRIPRTCFHDWRSFHSTVTHVLDTLGFFPAHSDIFFLTRICLILFWAKDKSIQSESNVFRILCRRHKPGTVTLCIWDLHTGRKTFAESVTEKLND